MKNFILFGGFMLCFTFASLQLAGTQAYADRNRGTEKAKAEIAGCTDPEIQGRATLKERYTEEGI